MRTPDEVLAYCNAATPGPWHTDNGNIFSGESLLLDHMQEFPTKDGLWRAGEQAMADCTMIANARTDLPELAEECKRLREIIKCKDQILIAYRTGDPRIADRALTRLEELDAEKGDEDENA